MRKKTDNSDFMNRRDVLSKSLGVVGGVATLPIVSAETAKDPTHEKFRALVSASKNIQDNRGVRARKDFLSKHNLDYANKRIETNLPSYNDNDSNEGLSAQRVDCVEPDKCPGDIDLNLSITSYSRAGYYYAELSTRIRYQYYTNSNGSTRYKGGEDPDDIVGIQWEKDHWKVNDRNDLDSNFSGDSHTEWDNGSWEYDGTGYRVDDYGLCKDSGLTSTTPGDASKAWSDYTYAGVYLELGPDWSSGDGISATYVHTWNSGGITIDSISFPFGISVSVSGGTDEENLQTELNGDNLIVYQSDS